MKEIARISVCLVTVLAIVTGGLSLTDILLSMLTPISVQTSALAPHNTTTSAPKLTGMVIPESTIVSPRKPTAIGTRATGTVTTTTVATDVATRTAVVRPSSSSPLLDRLVKNKPSIWGNKGLYILLGALYLTLMGLFLKRILDTLKRQP